MEDEHPFAVSSIEAPLNAGSHDRGRSVSFLRVRGVLMPGIVNDQISVVWRGAFANAEVNVLHAEAFDTRVFDESEWNWRELTERHSLGWVTARDGEGLVGFANVLWDGLVHAWIQDVMVARRARRRGIGVALVEESRDGARKAGCEYLHVDFDDHLRDFYVGACGFKPTNGGLIDLTS